MDYYRDRCDLCGMVHEERREHELRLQADLGKRATVRMTIPVVVSLEVSVANVGPDQEIIQRAKEILRGCTFLIQDRDLENLDLGDYRLTWDTEPLEVQIMSAQ